MTGFLPLVEGFLAFALTMLAFTTAVSAGVGVLHRLRRRRARGLRDMLRLLYATGIQPQLDELAEGSASGTREQRIVQRARFLAQMTLMPVPAVSGEGLDPDHPLKDQVATIERLEAWGGRREPRRPARPIHALARWRSLRFGLDALTGDELLQRLGSSTVGRELRGKLGEEEWSSFVDGLERRFASLGAAATETFSRHSRSWSIVVGALLALWLNIDSLDLVNSYLTTPALRSQAIAQASRLERIDETAEGGQPPAGLAEEVASARRELEGIRDSLGESFPIGWDRFPNCTPTSADPRCSRIEEVLAPAREESLGALRGSAARSLRELGAVVGAVSAVDPSAFSQWFVGVLLTVLFLGLGTPFWVQVVDAALSLSRTAKPKPSSTEGG